MLIGYLLGLLALAGGGDGRKGPAWPRDTPDVPAWPRDAPDAPADDAGQDASGAGGPCVGGGWASQLPRRGGAFSCRGRVMRFQLQSGDVSALDARRNHPAERAEIADRSKLPPQGEFWFSFAMQIEPGSPVTSKWMELGQLHASADPGSPSMQPPFAQGLDRNDLFRVIVRSAPGGARTSDQAFAQSKAATKVLYRQPNFPRGAFHSFVYRINYSPGADGGLDMWMDGQQKIAYTGPIGYPDQRGPYLKFGIYREPSQDRIAVDYANIEVGGPELRDRVAHPKPISAE